MKVRVSDAVEWEVPDPDSVTWQSPEVIVRGLNDEPVVGATWSCNLAYEQLSTNAYQQFFHLLGLYAEFELTTPGDTCPQMVGAWVESVEPRSMGNRYVLGADIRLSGIVLRTMAPG